MSDKDFINGCRNPIIKIYDGIYLIETINLPLPDKGGLIEDPGVESEETEYYDGEKDIDTDGYRITWDISYKSQTVKETSLAIYRLFIYQKNKFKMVLIPRADVPQRGFVVNFMNDSMPFGILKGGKKARGNKGMILKFETKYLEQDLKWTDPDNIPSFTYEMNESNGIF